MSVLHSSVNNCVKVSVMQVDANANANVMFVWRFVDGFGRLDNSLAKC